MAEPTTEKKENFVVKYFKDFNVLKEVSKEYWSLQIINVLDCTAYFAMFNIIILTLSSDFGFDDTNAGYVFTVFTSTTTISLFFSGVLTDWFGIKKALYVSITGLLFTRLAMVTAAYMPESTERDVLVIGALFLMAPFMAMLQTAFQAANKRFTTKRSRGAGFNLWYLFMNVGAMAGGFVVDIFFLNLGLERFQIFTLGAVMSLICLATIAIGIQRTEQVTGDDEEPDEDKREVGDDQKGFAKISAIVKAVASEPVFWRFTVLITLLLGVRMVFLYLGLLHPKFWTRVIGPDAAIGSMQAFNPIMVIIGLILLIPVLNRFSIFKMLIGGAFITSLSMFIIAIPPFGSFKSMDIGTFTYITSIGFLLVLTLGELIWSPRLQEYTAAIAPKGQEGTYLGLSMVPYFLAKTVLGVVSGHLLARWCPEFPKGEPIMGERIAAGQVAFVDSPYMMFLILAFVALGGTIVAWLLRGWFTKGLELEKDQPVQA